MAQEKPSHDDLLKMATRIVTAYASFNNLGSAELPRVIDTVYRTLSELNDKKSAAAARAGKKKPAVPIRKSITPDHIICLEDGRKLKMLKRHLRTAYGLSPEQYREKWGLPADYPMVAPNYAAQRSVFAKKIGLGRKPGETKSRRTGPKA